LFTTRSSLSPSATKVRFRNHLDHRPKREILKARLAHLQFLLRDSKPSLTQIAEMMQFKLTLELSRFLVRETGERQTFRRRQFTDDSSPIPRR
jgi:transcriptional regulator GlxA family with amidase domain